MNSSPPPLDPATLPPTEETRDWDGWSKEENLAGRVKGQPMSSSDIERRLIGRVLSGCYPNGDTFSEILGEDGVVRDPRSGDALAQYQIRADQLCFAYPNRPPACYTVSSDRRGLYFYRAGGFGLVASTSCPISE
ncbi:MAG: hypothetical protein AAF830_09265 [Pseudomonadota bacterium]